MTSATSASSGTPHEPIRPTTIPDQGRSQRSRYGLVLAGILIVLACVAAGGWYLYRASALRAIPSQIMAAERLLNAGKFVDARNKVQQVLWWQPRQSEALSIQGRCLLGEDSVDLATQVLSSIPEDSPGYEKGGQALATAYLKRGELELAEIAMRRYLDRIPTEDTVRDELRWLYFNQFRTRELLGLLEEKLQLTEPGPTSLPTLADLLDSEYRQQVPFEGKQYLAGIEQRKPGQGLVNLALGYADWRMGEESAARSHFQTALAAHPDHPQVRFTICTFLIEQGQFAEATSVLTRIPVPDHDDRYWALQSQLAEQAKDASLALKHLDRAIQLHGMDQVYAFRRVTLLRELGRDQGAPEAAKLAHELLKADRELADVVEVRAHYRPTKAVAARIAALCEQLGKTVQAKYWRLISETLPANRKTKR